jgi:transposase
VGVAPLIDGLAFDGFIADKALDSNSIIAYLNERGAKIVISQHPRRASPLPIDAEIYKWCHLIENFFCKLKEFKRIAMRADKTDQSFAAIIHLAAAVINSRRISTGPSSPLLTIISSTALRPFECCSSSTIERDAYHV